MKDYDTLQPHIGVRALTHDLHTIVVETFSEQAGIEYQICSDVIRMKDEVIRKALIQLGWTPPKEARYET